MAKELSREDQVLLRMLKTPPKHHAEMRAKPKPSRAKRGASKTSPSKVRGGKA